jgi:hypothetical protein
VSAKRGPDFKISILVNILNVAKTISVKEMRVLFLACLLLSALTIAQGKLLAQENVDRTGYVIGGSAGYGSVDVHTTEVAKDSYGTFALGFRGGYAVTPHAVIGVELNGWTLKAYNTEDPTKGESVSNVSVFVNYFPFRELPIYITAGGGLLSYTNNSPEVNGRDSGSSWFVGSGYEIPLSEEIMLVPQLRYSEGDFTGGDFRVYELALGVNWYFGK